MYCEGSIAFETGFPVLGQSKMKHSTEESERRRIHSVIILQNFTIWKRRQQEAMRSKAC